MLENVAIYLIAVYAFFAMLRRLFDLE